MPLDSIVTLWNDSTIRTVAAGASLLGAVAGMAGAFAVVRRKSLQGDAVSHAALPGVAFTYLIGTDSPIWLIIGGGVAGWVALGIVEVIARGTKTSIDTALAIILASFFGLGLAVKSYLQNNVSGAASSGLDRYLIGQAAYIQFSDVVILAVLAVVLTIIYFMCWSRLAIVSFDSEFAQTLGISSRIWSVILITTLVISAVVGLQAVGVVLMSALLVAPAVAARQLTHRLHLLIPLSALIGAISGITGTILSLKFSNQTKSLPTGPIIVLVATFIVLASIAFSQIKNRLNTSVTSA